MSVILNGQFKSILKRFGFNLQGGEIWFESDAKDWNILKTKYEVLSGIANRVPVDDDIFYNEFDIPKPEDYDARKQLMEQQRQVVQQPPQQQTDNQKAKADLYDFFVKPLYR